MSFHNAERGIATKIGILGGGFALALGLTACGGSTEAKNAPATPANQTLPDTLAVSMSYEQAAQRLQTVGGDVGKITVAAASNVSLAEQAGACKLELDTAIAHNEHAADVYTQLYNANPTFGESTRRKIIGLVEDNIAYAEVYKKIEDQDLSTVACRTKSGTQLQAGGTQVDASKLPTSLDGTIVNIDTFATLRPKVCDLDQFNEYVSQQKQAAQDEFAGSDDELRTLGKTTAQIIQDGSKETVNLANTYGENICY